MKEVQKIVVDLPEAIDSLVDLPNKVRKKKYSIYAKRVATVSKNSKNLEDFVENLLKDIAGDQLIVNRAKSDKLREILDIAKKNEKEILEYLKKYPVLSVVLLGSRRYEIEENNEAKTIGGD